MSKYEVRQDVYRICFSSTLNAENKAYIYFCISLAQPITFKQTLRNQTAEEGNSIILHCEISKPDTSVQWRKGSNLLRSGEKYKIRQRGCMLELKIFNLTQEDNGVYSCMSETVETSANITVSGKFFFFVLAQSVQYFSNSKISLLVEFNGFKDRSHTSLIKSKSLETNRNYLEINNNRNCGKVHTTNASKNTS